MRASTSPITVGDLRWRVRFDKQIGTDDTAGGALSEWQSQFSRFAAIIPLRGGEAVAAQRLDSRQPSLVIVRFDSETRQVTPDWRIVETLNGVPVKYFALKTAEDMERNRTWMTFMAVEGDPDGGTPDA